jgi:Tol biopolymer transport system component
MLIVLKIIGGLLLGGALTLVAAVKSLAWEYLPYGGKFSPDGANIAFISNETYGDDIYTVNADGSGKIKFDLPGGLWGMPYFSPNGSKVAFINTYDFFRNGNIFLVDVDGTDLTQVTAYGDDPAEKTNEGDRIGVLDTGLAFSPDGRRILYCSAEFGSSDVFSINVDGTRKTRLTDSAEYWETAPAFLPDGDRILYTVRNNDSLFSTEGEIWLMNADGSAKKRLLGPFRYELAAISPDGKRIAYGERRGDVRATYVASLDRRFKVADEGPADLDLSFSPDGTKVLYRLEGCVYIVDADGTGKKNLTPGWDFARSPAFFPDGTKIALAGAPGGSDVGIRTMGVDGSSLTNVIGGSVICGSDIAVSPQGDRILLRGGVEGEDEYSDAAEYFVIDLKSAIYTQLTRAP